MRLSAWCIAWAAIGVAAGCSGPREDSYASQAIATSPALLGTSATAVVLDGGPPSVAPPQQEVDAAQPPSADASVDPDSHAAALCALPEQNVVRASDDADFLQHVIGNWALCGAVSVFGTNEQGLAIHADGSWQRLYLTGGLLAPKDDEPAGRWQLIEPAPYNSEYGLDLHTAVGSFGTYPAFVDSPRKMRLNNNGVFVADYVIEQGTTTIEAPPIQYTVSYPPQACAAPPPGDTRFANAEEASGRLVGRWLSCGGSPFGTEEVGIEFAADGTWHKLDLVSADTVVRAQGFDQEGRWSLIDMSTINGPGSFQLNLDIAGGGGIGSLLSVTESPRRLYIINNGVFAADYAIDP